MYNKYIGVILKRHPLGEADELLTIYTREAGKLRCKAIGSRKIRSRLGGNLQSLNEIEFEVAGSKSRLPVIISVRARTINNYLRENLKKFAFALVGIETLYRITPDEEPNEKIYEALVNFLGELGQTSEENLEVRRFQLKLLEVSGYGNNNPSHPPLTFPPEADPPWAERGGVPPLKVRGGEGELLKLTPDLERKIDKFLENVLEREIKSSRFLESL